MERNKAYKAFLVEDATWDGENFVIPCQNVRTLYDGRYTCVAGFIYAVIAGRYCVLANLRGDGAPDFRGFWNCPCGYLERGENSVQGVCRETLEETTVFVPENKVKILNTQTEPSECNHGNVTIHHTAYMGRMPRLNYLGGNGLNGGEENEVADIQWIPLRKVRDKSWAFGHEKLIYKYAGPWWLRFWRVLFG